MAEYVQICETEISTDCSVTEWVSTSVFNSGILPPLSIQDSLTIAASMLGLVAIAWGIKQIGRVLH